MNKIDISLIITTYNWPQALKVCLDSVQRQSMMPSQVIIADDGSGDETRELIERYKKESSIPLLHVWHEDLGFRRSAILNKALRSVDANNYVIFIDGDIILHRHFVADHARLAEHGYYVFGRRCFISEKLSKKILEGHGPKLSIFTSGIKKRDNAIYLPWLTSITKSYKRNQLYGTGCNIAAWVSDIIRMNGYDEKMEGWGFEDLDFIQRLRNMGLVSKAAKFQAIEFHLYHKQLPPSEENSRLWDKTLENKSTRCEYGLEYPT